MPINRKIQNRKVYKAKRRGWLAAPLLIALLLSACGRATPVDQPAPTEQATNTPSATATNTPAPTPTATPTPKVINVDTAKDLILTDVFGNGALLDVYFSLDGSLMITSFKHAIEVMEAATLKEVCHIQSVDEIGFSAITNDNQTIVAGIDQIKYTEDPIPFAMLTWDVNTCSLIKKETNLTQYPFYFTNGGEDVIFSIAFEYIKEEGYFNTYLQKRDPISLEVRDQVENHNSGLIDYSTSSQRIAIKDQNSLNVYAESQGLDEAIFDKYLGYYETNDVYFSLSPSGNRLAYSRWDKDGASITLAVWDVGGNGLLFEDHPQLPPISSVKFLTEDKLAVATWKDLEIFDLVQKKYVYTEEFQSLNPRNSTTWNADRIVIQPRPGSDEYAVVIDYGTNVVFQIRDANSNKILRTTSILGVYEAEDFYSPVIKATDSDLARLAIQNGALQDFDTFSDKYNLKNFVIPQEILHLSNYDKRISMSKDGEYLAIRIYQYPDPAVFYLFKQWDSQPLITETNPDMLSLYAFQPILSPDGNYFALEIESQVSEGRTIFGSSLTIKTWSLPDLTPLPEITLPGYMGDIALTNDGLLLVSEGYPDTGFSIWNAQTGQQVYSGLRWIPGGQFFMTRDDTRLVVFSTAVSAYSFNRGTANPYPSRVFFIFELK